MKKVIVKNLSGVQTHGAEMDDPKAWVDDCVANKVWGDDGSYTVEITDITAQIEQEQVNRDAEEYLRSTDWMVLRHIRQKALGNVQTLTDEQYLAFEQTRAEKAALIERRGSG